MAERVSDEKRLELIAVTKSKSSPNHLDIWALLPQTNCKQCGEVTCLAFAVALIKQQRELSESKPLQLKEIFEERLTTLKFMLS